jgi:hypothetical protein
LNKKQLLDPPVKKEQEKKKRYGLGLKIFSLTLIGDEPKIFFLSFSPPLLFQSWQPDLLN